jgi:LysM repeat protein
MSQDVSPDQWLIQEINVVMLLSSRSLSRWFFWILLRHLSLRLLINTALLILVTTMTTAQEQGAARTEEYVTHIVQSGESLYSIAMRYGVTMGDIAEANELTNWIYLTVGQELIIPGLESPGESVEEEVVENPLVAGAPEIHIVAPGETLASIANRYGITVADLLKANNIANPDLIYRGQELSVWTTESVEIAEPVEETLPDLDLARQINLGATPIVPANFDLRTAAAVQATHIVQPGETLYRIATQYGVTWQQIVEVNTIPNIDNINIGLELIIPSAEAEGTPLVEGIQGPAIIPPTPAITTGRFIFVDLSDSMVYAFEDGVLVYMALGSMGVPATPTVQGEYRIYSRYPAQTMSGPGYYLPNVEWVQYFYQGYALHGAYWHSNWGRPMSHGCVNLRNEDAKWLYDFGEIGTPVHVRS